MTIFELTNKQREFFGLDPIKSHWERVMFNGDTYRPESVLYFDGDMIKRHIVSIENKYIEVHYDDSTKGRTILLPKTAKGKDKKLTASVLEQRQPKGVYLVVSNGGLTIGNYQTQTTFYSSHWENIEENSKTVSELVSEFIEQSPENHLAEIRQFKNAKRKHVKFRTGDYFCFKLDRRNFGFGRLLLDVSKIRKKGLISGEHGLSLFMGQPLMVELFAFKSPTKNVSISVLDDQPKLPSDVMMDNLLLYGEYEIIGHRELKDYEFDFPISYGRSIDQRKVVFLQWGLIHRELPQTKYHKYIVGENEFDQNPYGYYSIGFRPHYNTTEVIRAVANNGVYDFNTSKHAIAKRDLRNPINRSIKDELFKVFGLDSNKNYFENCKLVGTISTNKILLQLLE